MNAVFQCLRYSPGFLEFFWKSFIHHDKSGEAFAKALHDLFTKMLTTRSGSIVNPRSFIRTFIDTSAMDGRLDYIFRQQMDSSEFLQYLLDMVVTYQSRPVKMSITPGSGGSDTVHSSQTRALESWISYYEKGHCSLIENFYGQMQTTGHCTNCKTQTSETYEPLSKIEASIPDSNIQGARAPTVFECLKLGSFGDEIIDDYKCDTCHVRGNNVFTRRMSRFPEELIIVLKRFTRIGGHTGTSRKVRGGILWDLDKLDLTELAAFPCPFKTSVPIYKTYAIIEHLGPTIEHGHYTMRARHGSKWIEYNDSMAHEIPEDHVITDNSYIIFATSNDSYDSFQKEMYPKYKKMAEAIYASTPEVTPAVVSRTAVPDYTTLAAAALAPGPMGGAGSGPPS
jgi:ubiquitin C-terminal hydrolase